MYIPRRVKTLDIKRGKWYILNVLKIVKYLLRYRRINGAPWGNEVEY